MLYEVRVAADSDQEFADVLEKVVGALRGIPANGNLFSFSRYRDPEAMLNVGMRVSGGASGGLPLTQEAYDAAAKASQDNAALAPAKRGRPAKVQPPTATIVNGPDGEPAAAMEESPFGAAPPDEDDPDAAQLSPAQMRDEAIGILQSVFAIPAGPPAVRALQTKLKVKKFNEVPDTECAALLAASKNLYRQIKATAA